MFYRLSGIKHVSYAADRQLWPVPFDRYLVIAAVILGITAPFYLSPLYLGSYMLPWIIWATAALSLNLLMGWAGQIHLGFAAVMAIGAYSAIHLARAGVPFELALLLAGLLSALIGMIFGAAALRVKGLYLAVSTLAMQYMIDWIISHVPAISGGSQATLQTPVIRILGFPVDSDAGRYWVALAVCALVTIFMLNVKRTSFGRALVAVREKDFAAAIIGVNPFYYKLVAFWVSSFLGGVSGAVLAFCYYRAVTPEQFHLDVSIQAVAMVIVGGMGSILGSFFGAALVLLAPIVLNNFVGWFVAAIGLSLSPEVLALIPLILYGGLIVGFLLFEPLGLAKIYDNIRNYFLVWPFRHARR
ncbi:MAG TPA: branched-chain amino acid ABC transporter permease [Ferrovibrio sp.]|jgi:branched-chain amino acid transport system permease protein|uniref:branched-chain amino acid ABC transporter permease n=1 Tax=Ferrovibrio sp. TaxID=1917215 RepID=UPI0026293ED5|nr:branched-chain amino acid ABC transporter permease [Ferrovibrio sp.]HLT77078.1 branched-chain amino acid ABC transporter permease [Ferrovibrio sp.]